MAGPPPTLDVPLHPDIKLLAERPLSADCFAIACRAMVEGFFAKLTRRRLKNGVFHSLVDLQAAINRFIAEHNDTEAKPFTWRADPDEIIAARNRGFQMLDSIH